MVQYWFFLFICLTLSLVLSAYHLMHIAMLVFLALIGYGFLMARDRVPVLAGACLVILGMGLATLNQSPGEFIPTGDQVIVTGTIKSFPRCLDQTTRFVVQTDGLYNRERLLVICEFKARLHKGEQLAFRGSIQLPQEPGNPGEFDYPAYLALDKIRCIAYVENPEDIRIISSCSMVQNFVNRFRERAQRLLLSNLKQDTAAILMGMVLGDRDQIDPEQYSVFQKIGTAHLFAISGLHVGFLLLFWLWITSFLGFSKTSGFYSSIAVLLLYGSIIGWPVSVARATAMAIIGLIAYYTGRRNHLLNSLGIAGLIILVLDPNAPFRISFQLSFLATWGLIYIYPRIRGKIPSKNRLWDLALVPLAAQAAVLPLMSYHFNLLSPVSLLSNIISSYLAGISVILGFAALLFSFLPGISAVFLVPAGFIIEIILKSSNVLAYLPMAYTWVATPSLLLVVLYYGGLIIVIENINNFSKKGIVTGGVIIGLCIAVICLPAWVWNRGVMEVVFIEVGQGDCILVKTPQGKFILVDGGGSQFYDVGTRKVLPYLKHRGIRTIDLAINTHPDIDHLGGLETVIEGVKVRYVGIPSSLYSCREYTNFKEKGERYGIPLLLLKGGDRLDIEEKVTVQVLDHGSPALSDFNDQSIVLYLKYREFSAVLCGDLGTEGLQQLTFTHSQTPVTVVKVPHHGSRSSLLPEFYDRIKPAYAVISVGNNNRFGHPHPEVIDELADRNITTYRTDVHGAVTVLSDGFTVRVKSYH